jgi:uncharacterized protein
MSYSTDPMMIIEKYYERKSAAYDILIAHSKAVARKSLAIAEKLRHMNPDEAFIEAAAMLHDIGILRTKGPGIGCHGDQPYICHGYIGREILEREGLPRHGLVCERHVGVGISILDIDTHRLPLPKRDMMPLSLEEQIICYADKFFSKKQGEFSEEKSLEKVRGEVLRYGKEKLGFFDELHSLFNK